MIVQIQIKNRVLMYIVGHNHNNSYTNEILAYIYHVEKYIIQMLSL